MVNVKPIRNDEDLGDALAQVSKLWGAPPGTADGDRLEVLVALIDSYERQAHTIDKPTPIEAIKARLDQMGMTRKDLERILGGRSRVSEILKQRRGLSLAMIRRLSDELKMPADLLIAPTVPKRVTARAMPLRSAPRTAKLARSMAASVSSKGKPKRA